MPKYLTELLGTFYFVLLIALIVNAGGVLAPLIIGLSLMVVIYMGGWISGAHFNPAVSLSLVVRGALPAGDFAPYAVAQLVGGALGGLVACKVFGRSFLPAPGEHVLLANACIAEVLFTFLFCLVVMNVATTKKIQGNSFYGLAIGMTVAVSAYGAANICGGAFNPAVAFGGVVSKADGFPIHILW